MKHLGMICALIPLQALAQKTSASNEVQKAPQSNESQESSNLEKKLDVSPRHVPPSKWNGAHPTLGPSWSLLFGLGSRGSIGESSNFETSLGAEIGIGIPVLNGFDAGIAVGQFLSEGQAAPRYEGILRYFFLMPQGGPYIGTGISRTSQFKENRDQDLYQAFLTLGLFGGEGIYCEFDFRSSQVRPIAMIFEFGLRYRPEIFQRSQNQAHGPLVTF